MTWSFGVGQSSLQQWVATCLAFSVILGACGDDDDAPTKSLVVTAPMADAELSMADDADLATDGLQYEVMITTTGLAVGTELRVLIGEGDQEKQVGTAEVSADGTATATATLDPGQKSIFVKTENAEITSDATQSYTFRMLEITSPMAGVIDGDADASLPGAQVNVSVAAYAITGDLTLAVDGTDLVGTATITDGVAVFGVTLEAGTHTLVAKSETVESAAIESAAVEVSVMRQCGSLVLISPRAGSDGRLVLGGSDNSCPTDGTDYTSTFEVSTDIGDDLPARLFVNGSMVKSAMVAQTLATFEDVVLDSRAMASTVRVEIDAPEGTCSRTFELELFVDCAGPGCTIVSPTPFEVTDGTTTTAYLNRALGNGEYTVEVSSDTEVIGRDIELIVDGNTANPLAMQAADDSGTALATFEDVALADGSHSVRARCTDVNGNVTMSAEASWMVDTTPCSVAISSPAGNTSIYTDDDANGSVDGTQYAVSATVTGGDCQNSRAAVCNPANGIADGAFSTFVDGAGFEVTLNTALTSQNLCIEVQDRAGNVGLGAVQVDHYDETRPIPDCEIVSPTPFVGADSTEYLNASASAGGGMFTVEVASSASTVGQTIELAIDGNANPATATAVVDGAGSKATFSVLLPDGDHSLVASCTAPGGVPRLSGQKDWKVDTTPCSVALTSPAANTKVFFDDDIDSVTADIQTEIRAMATGGGCSDARAMPCDPGVGIVAGSFAPYTDGDALTVTLETGVETQDLCVEYRDLAGNIGFGSVAIESPQTNRPIPNCAIVSPTPYVNGSEYLNSDDGNGDGTFTVEVDTSDAVAGVSNGVELVVTGGATQRLFMDASASGLGAKAIFTVTMPDGPYAVVANCTDVDGTPSTSATENWIVDTEACQVAVTSPAPGTKVFLDDDVELSTAAVVDTMLTANSIGASCADVRVASCDTAVGIATGSFSPFIDAAPMTVALAGTVTTQDLCVEIRDQAGNVGLGSVAIESPQTNRPIPTCEIVSPSPVVNGDEYLNSDLGNGDGTFTVEVDASPAVAGVSNGVELVVTGGTTLRLFADASAFGPGAKAIFEVPMPDGSYAVVANCTDSDGTPSTSDTENWIVDTQACQVAVTSPAPGTKVFLDDDVELSTAGVVDTTLTANSIGDSCTDVRAASCDTGAGIAAGSFSTFTDGAPMTVALAGTVTTQDLCVEIRDQAGNIGLGSVAIESPQTNRPIPNCEIVSPSTYLGQYLNSDAGNGTFSVQVDTAAEAAGLAVELVVDGNTASKLSATALAGGSSASATFALSLSEGPHTVVANCVDDNGTPSSSAQSDWIVDTQGCDVVITGPSAGAVFILADDTDGVAAGTQVLVDATVTGAACDAARAVPCDGVAIAEGDFGAFTPGDPLSVTLDASNAAQNLCLEVRDIAGNVTIDSVAVEHFSRIPVLSVLSPADGTLYNSTGADGQGNVFEVDEDPGTSECQATFTVACSELGLPVELVRQPSNGVSAETVLGSVLCSAGGQAVFSQISFQDLADSAASFEARQTYSADSGDQVGTATAINVDGQCEVLALSYASTLRKGIQLTPLTSCPSRVGTSGVSLDVLVQSTPVVSGTATLTTFDANGADVTIGANVKVNGAGYFNYFNEGIVVGSTQGMALVSVAVVDDFNNSASANCQYSVSDSNLALAIAVASPPETTSFTVATADNAACPNNGTGQFQVPFELTIDGDSQASPGDRSLSYNVNGGSTVSVPVANAGQVLCADVPEGASIVQGTLQDNLGSDQDSQQISVTVDTLNVTAPVAGDKFAGANGAGCIGAQTLVTANFHAIYPDNEPVTIQTDLQLLNTTVQSGAISVCVGLAAGPQSVVVTVPSTGATETVADVTFLNSPTIDNVSFSVSVPLDTLPAYRTTPIDITWTLPSGGFYEFVDYQFGCDPSPLNTTDNNVKVAWWGAAQSHLFADGTTSRFTATGTDTTAGTLELATGGVKLHCVVRLCDASDRCTGIPDTSTEVQKPFRSLLVDGTVPGELMGSSIEPVGDVNGDGVNDALISAPTAGGADSAVYLYFGVASGEPNPTPSVKITTAPVTNVDTFGPFGRGIAGLGDVSGDGRPDFAVTRPYGNSYSGMVYVFFGRDAGDPWPAEIDLDAGVNASGCDADLCIQQTAGPAGTSAINFGSSVAGVGDFDGIPPNDIAIGASYSGTKDGIGTGDPPDGALYVILGRAFASCDDAECTNRGAGVATWGISADVQPGASADLDGFYLTLVDTNQPSGGANFGERVVAVGDMHGSGDGRQDLVVVATKTHTIYSLTGRPYTETSGLEVIGQSEMAVVYDGSTFSNFAVQVRALGNVFDPPGGGGTTVGVPDLGVWSNFASGMYVFPGDTSLSEGFDTDGAKVMYIQGDAGTLFGKRGCTGLFPALSGLTNDIDGDGMTDFCAGSEKQDGVNPPGAGYYFPGDTIMSQTRQTLTPQGTTLQFQHVLDQSDAGGVINPGTSSVVATETGVRTPQVVGDLTGDGSPDLLMGDVPVGAAETEGGFWLLY